MRVLPVAIWAKTNKVVIPFSIFPPSARKGFPWLMSWHAGDDTQCKCRSLPLYSIRVWALYSSSRTGGVDALWKRRPFPMYSFLHSLVPWTASTAINKNKQITVYPHLRNSDVWMFSLLCCLAAPCLIRLLPVNFPKGGWVGIQSSQPGCTA